MWNESGTLFRSDRDAVCTLRKVCSLPRQWTNNSACIVESINANIIILFTQVTGYC